MQAPISDPSAASEHLGLAQALPKIWIGYALCLATFVAEGVFVAYHPELSAGQLVIPPLPLFLLGFVSFVYWLVCVHQLHVVLAHVPGWRHQVSPARAVWFHFIPVYSLYWLYKWPSEAAAFVNWKLQATAVKPRNSGILVLASYIFCVLLGPGGLFLLFLSLSHLTNWVRRALLTPHLVPPVDDGSAQ